MFTVGHFTLTIAMKLWLVFCVLAVLYAANMANDSDWGSDEASSSPSQRYNKGITGLKNLLRLYLDHKQHSDSTLTSISSSSSKDVSFVNSRNHDDNEDHDFTAFDSPINGLFVASPPLPRLGGAAHIAAQSAMGSAHTNSMGGATYRVIGPAPDRDEGRVTWGQDADIRDHPYQLQLGVNGDQHCSASIIDKMWALTVAGCLYDWTTNDRIPTYLLTLRAGTTTRNVGGGIRRLSTTIIHPSYDHYRNTHDYDIALIKVRTGFMFTPLIKPIALPSQGAKLRDGTVVTVSGWGARNLNDVSEVLQTTKIRTVKQEACQNRIIKPLTTRMFCASEGRKGPCKKDEGGALVVNNVIMGMYSWGDLRCSNTGIPGVFTKVAEFRNWIRNIAQV